MKKYLPPGTKAEPINMMNHASISPNLQRELRSLRPNQSKTQNVAEANIAN